MLVVEEPPNSPSNVHLGREYLYRKLFDRSSREAFLEDLSSLNVLPMPSFQASNCANATLHEPIVFYPRTSEMVNYGNFLDLVLPRLTSGEISAQEQLVLSNLAFENHLAQAGIDAAAIAEWRQSKEPQYLEQAGIDYLFFDLQWTGWLSEQEYQLMLGEDSPYEIAARWVHPARETVYYLLQVPQKAQSQLNPVP
jgi:hypothetical protein